MIQSWPRSSAAADRPIRSAPCAVIQLSDLCGVLSNEVSNYVGQEYNESMNCQVKDELVSQLIALNNKLNLLSPDLVHGDGERAEVQQQRENLYAEIKHHRAKCQRRCKNPHSAG